MQYQAIASVSDLPEGKRKLVKIGSREILIVNVDGVFHALDSSCSHRGAPLAEGVVVDGQLLCPWHGSTFDVAAGRCLANPGEKIQTYPVEIRGEAIWIEFESAA
jgi:nitrite reductase/ring-hydroxylating ferredoxin subunit